jgi:CubicO group peptidase (beta-lactamase class C family)
MSWLDAAPYEPSSFYRVRATARPFTVAQLAAAAEYSRMRGGTSVVVMQHGALVFEDYHNGANTNTATHVHSATKAFWACALAAAIQDGLISGYDEPAFTTITEWQDNTLHPGKRLITLGHLASLCSGLSQDVDYIQGTDPLADDIYDYVVNSLRVTSYPGTTFEYGPSHYYVFGVLLQRKLALAGTPMNPLQYLQARILAPLGIEYVNWEHDVAGNPHIPNGCTLTPRNWIKLGQFFLQQGWWNGREVIASTRMAELRVATGPNPGHGKFLWLNQQGGYPPAGLPLPPPGIPGGFIYYDGYTDIVAALGAGKNRMYVIPSLNAVIARQTLLENDAFEDTEFLATLLVESASSVIEPAQSLPP